MTNEYGEKLDSHGYVPSIMQSDLSRCYRCGRTTGKLDFHEVFGGSNRKKSKNYGLWVVLCHDSCHLGTWGVHYNAEVMEQLHREGQIAAMEAYGLSKEEFIKKFGKNYLED